MSRSELQEQAFATSDQYRALFAVSDAIASHRDLSLLFHELGNRLVRVVGFDALSLVLHDAAILFYWLLKKVHLVGPMLTGD